MRDGYRDEIARHEGRAERRKRVLILLTFATSVLALVFLIWVVILIRQTQTTNAPVVIQTAQNTKRSTGSPSASSPARSPRASATRTRRRDRPTSSGSRAARSTPSQSSRRTARSRRALTPSPRSSPASTHSSDSRRADKWECRR
jgi:cytoskeletal protein RodZ